MSEIQREIWSKQIFNQLVEAGITLFAYIPDFGNDNIIKLAEEHNKTRTILLTSEEEGVGICAGADLVGERAVLCMQSSGVGNCPNFLSLIKGGGFPILLLVTMRGDYGEQNPWQYPMGQAVEPVLKAMGIQTIRVERQDELEEATTAAVSGAFKANQGIALVLSQKFLGTKEF
ncbi:MAG: phosphonopyruvate decarboxylase [Pseudomonadota bacterium]|jgi:sulfopyruvate decarboxylase alpha subunit|nr:phosphonopyruvate decarboxylase [Pseudomonadota bacterium]